MVIESKQTIPTMPPMLEYKLFKKGEIGNKKIYFNQNPSKSFEFTKEEIFLIKYFCKMKYRDMIKLNLIPISRRLHLDFVGFDNPAYNDVLICKGTQKVF